MLNVHWQGCTAAAGAAHTSNVQYFTPSVVRLLGFREMLDHARALPNIEHAMTNRAYGCSHSRTRVLSLFTVITMVVVVVVVVVYYYRKEHAGYIVAEHSHLTGLGLLNLQ